MKERGISFSGDMVRSILRGTKTLTRRPVSKNVRRRGLSISPSGEPYSNLMGVRVEELCPYGKVGDLLWVRETWSATRPSSFNTVKPNKEDKIWYKADNNRPTWAEYGWQPPMFMPRLASRITLKILYVRIEHIKDITENECVTEGIKTENKYIDFRDLWNEIYFKKGYGWDVNPWVWVIRFENTHESQINQVLE